MDDKSLIEKVNNGNLSAVRLLVEGNKNLIWHIIISMTGRNCDNEDLFQEVFFRVLKGAKYFRADARLSTWIGSIAHHVCVDYLRKKNKEFNFISNECEENSNPTLVYDRSWKETENKDLHQLIIATIEKLPANYRTVITLYHLDELTYREISEITGMPEGTIKSCINRGRNMLRETLLMLVPDVLDILADL